MRREGLAVGLFFVVAGALFFFDAVEVVSIRAGYLWPLLLIGFGIALIAGGRRRPEPAPPAEEHHAEEREAGTAEEHHAEEREAGTAEDASEDPRPPQERRDDWPGGSP